MKILMLSSPFPYPPTRGGTQVRTFNLLKYLSQTHDITLITQRPEEVSDTEVEELQKWVENLLIFPQPKPSEIEAGILAKVQRFKTFLQQGTPPSVLYHYANDIQEWIDEAVKTAKFDVITCEHSVNEIYIRPEWQQQIRTVVNIHSSIYGSCLNQLETKTSENQLRDQLNLPLLRRYETQYCSKFTDIVVTTPEDRRQIATFNPDAKIAVIPNGVDLTLYPKRTSDPGGYQLVFVGAMDTLANIDAAHFFLLRSVSRNLETLSRSHLKPSRNQPGTISHRVGKNSRYYGNRSRGFRSKIFASGSNLCSTTADRLWHQE